MSQESNEENEHESSTTTTEEEADNTHRSNAGNLLQTIVQRSPLRCGACREGCTHSMREDTVIDIPHVKLPAEEDDDGDNTAPGRTYEIQVLNLSYYIIPSRAATGVAPLKALTGSPVESRTILHKVHCSARPGELLAIAGPSGAGKSTLLELLAGRIRPTTDSSILVNSQLMEPSSFRRVTGYVMQQDTLFPMLTVLETFMFSAKLRLPSSMSPQRRRARVERLMKELGLQHVSSSRIGSDAVRGISGGERRRVSIGVDVIHDPAVLLLDEPTSGLDSNAALQVVAMLHTMARSHKRTIILSIHQPGYRIVELIDSLVLLAKGGVVHCGTMQQLDDKLSAAGHNTPPHMNVLEFAIEKIDMLEPDPGGDRIIAESFNVSMPQVRSSLQDLFNQVKVHGNCNASPPALAAASAVPAAKPTFANPWFRETLILSDRCWKVMIRTKHLAGARVLQAICTGLALGSIFFHLTQDVIGIEGRYGFFAFTLTFLMTSTSEALPMFLEDRPIFMRETSRGAHRVSSYVVSNTLVYLPFLFVFSLLYTGLTFCLVGLNHTAGSYGFFLLTVWMAVFSANSLVAFISTMVPDYIMGNTFVTGTLGAFFLFSGYFVKRTPKYWLFMEYISLFKYPLDAMLINEYGSAPGRCFKEIGQVCAIPGQAVLANAGLQHSSKWMKLAVMVAFSVLYRFLSYVVLRFRPRHKQE